MISGQNEMQWSISPSSSVHHQILATLCVCILFRILFIQEEWKNKQKIVNWAFQVSFQCFDKCLGLVETDVNDEQCS